MDDDPLLADTSAAVSTPAASSSATGSSSAEAGGAAGGAESSGKADVDEDGVGRAPARWTGAWAVEKARALVRKPAGADLSTGAVLSYGMVGVVVALLSDVPAIFLTAFLLQVPRMNALAAGQMLLIAKVCVHARACAPAPLPRAPRQLTAPAPPRPYRSRLCAQVFDAVTDPIIGTASDATRNRFGRRRPWMVASVPISVAFNILLFQHWTSLDGNAPAIFAYYLVCLCMSTFGMTCYWIPAAALPVTISAKDIDRVRLVSTRAINVFLATIVGVLIMGLFVNTFPTAEKDTGFLIAAVINSALITVAAFVSVFGIPEPSSLKVQGGAN